MESRRDPRWLLNLDPKTLGFKDERLRHLVWCDEEGCRTGERWAKLVKLWGAHSSPWTSADEAEEEEGEEVMVEEVEDVDEQTGAAVDGSEGNESSEGEAMDYDELVPFVPTGG